MNVGASRDAVREPLLKQEERSQNVSCPSDPRRAVDQLPYTLVAGEIVQRKFDFVLPAEVAHLRIEKQDLPILAQLHRSPGTLGNRSLKDQATSIGPVAAHQIEPPRRAPHESPLYGHLITPGRPPNCSARFWRLNPPREKILSYLRQLIC